MKTPTQIAAEAARTALNTVYGHAGTSEDVERSLYDQFLTAIQQATEEGEKEKIAPVQGYAAGIPWSMHLRAYDVYCKRYGAQDAMITGWCRGGFAVSELDMFIPGWREELSEAGGLRAQLRDLTNQLVARDGVIAKVVAQRDRHIALFNDEQETTTAFRAELTALRGLLNKSLGALLAAKADCLSDRKTEDDRRSASGSPVVEWPIETPYDWIIDALRAHLATERKEGV